MEIHVQISEKVLKALASYVKPCPMVCQAISCPMKAVCWPGVNWQQVEKDLIRGQKPST